MKTVEVRIQILRDSKTKRCGLMLLDQDGNGKRISIGKDTGHWNAEEIIQCRISEDDLNEYDRTKKQTTLA